MSYGNQIFQLRFAALEMTKCLIVIPTGVPMKSGCSGGIWLRAYKDYTMTLI